MKIFLTGGAGYIGSIAAAEEKLGEGAQMGDAVAALARARVADRANDKAACERALADVRRALATPSPKRP